MTHPGPTAISPDQEEPIGADPVEASTVPPSEDESVSLPSAGPEPEIVDVWSRTAPKYRRRAWLFLLTSALLFAGLCSFAFWIRTGELLAPALPNYGQLLWDCFDWRNETPITLTDMLFYPIHVQRVPMMLVIVGVTVGTLIAIPILVAILYRFPASLIFASMLALLSLMPWLAVNVVIACRISAFRKIRMRYASALIGLFPLVLYFILSTSGTAATQLAPAEQIKLYFPWILAMLWAAVLMGVVLALARVVNYRPGVIAPLLAVSLAVPVVLFENRVGRDELYYRLLEHELGPRSRRHFAVLDNSAMIGDVAARRVARGLEPKRSVQEVRDRLKQSWYLPYDEMDAEIGELQSSLVQSQHEVARSCEAFLRDFSQSPYVPCALYLKARALDLRVDAELFRYEGALRYHMEFPSLASRDPWIRLLNQFPNSALSAVARVRLAIFQAREGRIDDAIALLTEVEQFAETEGGEEGRSSGLFGAEAPEASLGVALDLTIEEARRLRALLERNRDAQNGDAALAAMMRMDPRHRLYGRNLELLQRRFPDGPLTDNIEVARALLSQSRELRILQLSALAEGIVGDDAIERVLYELGSVYEEDSQPEKAAEAWGRLISEFPDSPWTAEAARRVDRIERRLRSRS